MDDFSISKFAGVAPEDRNRLYRDWILPELTLSDTHKTYLRSKFELNNHGDCFSHMGNIKIKLGGSAPLEEISTLPCVTVHEQDVHLAGPKDGGMLLAVVDIDGYINGFQIISNKDIQQHQLLDEPPKIQWWRAAGVPRPILPNGELPLHFTASLESKSVVLAHGPLSANIISERWAMSAISTCETDFSRKTLAYYLTFIHPDIVYIMTDVTDQNAQMIRNWQLGRVIQRLNYDVRFLSPSLSEKSIPDAFDQCSQLKIDTYYDSFPRSLKNKISGDKSSLKTRVRDGLMKYNAKRRMEATQKIRVAISELQESDPLISISALARKAGVAQSTVKTWMKNNGFADTKTLQMAMAEGGIDISDPVLPLDDIDEKTEAFVTDEPLLSEMLKTDEQKAEGILEKGKPDDGLEPELDFDNEPIAETQKMLQEENDTIADSGKEPELNTADATKEKPKKAIKIEKTEERSHAGVKEDAPKTIIAELVDATQEQSVEDLPIEEAFKEKVTVPPKTDQPPDKTIEVKVIDDDALKQKSSAKWIIIALIISLVVITAIVIILNR